MFSETSRLNVSGRITLKRELGIARCGLACCLCSESVKCNGCNSNDWCINKNAQLKKD